MLRHPAGRIGVTLGLAIGFIVTVTGGTSKALLFAGLCRYLAGRLPKM
jgi:hypothetical protein